MSIKTIVVPFQGHDEEVGALLTALHLAKEFDAHVEVWHISPNLSDMIAPFVDYAPFPVYPVIYKDVKKANDKRVAEIEVKCKKIISQYSRIAASFHHRMGHMAELIGIRSRVADLIIVSRAIRGGEDTSSDILHQLLFHSGHPVLLVPAGNKAIDLKNNMIAWDGSAEAATAVSFSMPFLRREGVDTFVLTVLTDNITPPLSIKDMQVYLSRHGIQTKPIEYETAKANLGKCIADTSKAHSANLIIMGAYNHTRMQEIIFGGATKYMLDKADTPVLLAR